MAQPGGSAAGAHPEVTAVAAPAASPLIRSDGHVDGSALGDALERAVSEQLHLDNSRRAFVHETARTLAHLVNGKLVHQTNFRRLLLGRKGVGKVRVCRVGQIAAGSPKSWGSGMGASGSSSFKCVCTASTGSTSA